MLFETTPTDPIALATPVVLLLIVGIVIIFAGILMNLQIYFQSTSLFNTIVMLVLLAGGIGLIFRALAPHGQR